MDGRMTVEKELDEYAAKISVGMLLDANPGSLPDRFLCRELENGHGIAVEWDGPPRVAHAVAVKFGNESEFNRIIESLEYLGIPRRQGRGDAS